MLRNEVEKQMAIHTLAVNSKGKGEPAWGNHITASI
jgi:hypothetical protein